MNFFKQNFINRTKVHKNIQLKSKKIQLLNYFYF